METQNKQPKYIQGYWRNKTVEPEAEPKKQNDLVGVLMLGSILIFLAIMFWYITVGAAALGATAYGIKKYTSRPQQEKLVINYYGG